jgi:hypothetical protein
MISYHADDSGRILTLSYRRHVTPREMEDCLDALRHRMGHLRPGYVLLSDLTSLDSMDLACAETLGVIMELISERGPSLVLRVIPDPSKDIGLNLISLFHYQKPVRVFTLPNLAEALKVMLDEVEWQRPG